MSAVAIATVVCGVLTAAALAAAGRLGVDLGGPAFTLTILPITLLATAHLVNFLKACVNRSGRDALHELAIVIVAMFVVSLGAGEYAKGLDGGRGANAAITRRLERAAAPSPIAGPWPLQLGSANLVDAGATRAG